MQTGHACRQAGFVPILLLVGVLILVAVAAGAYYFGKSQTPKPQNQVVSQTPQPTSVSSSVPAGTDPTANPDQIGANWKTYTYKNSFSFKYPSGWYVYDFSDCLAIENEDDEASALAISLKPKDNFCHPEMTITLWLKGEEGNENCYPESLYTISSRDIFIDKHQARQIIIENPRGTGRNETLIGFKRNNQCFSINNREQLVPENIFNQILSTFKFTQ